MRTPPLPVAALGIALTLAIAILAAAPAAQARPVFSISIPSRLEGERKGSDRFVIGGTEIACDRLSYRGFFYNGGPDGRSATLEVLPEHYDCTAKVLIGLTADFFQEACDYLLHDVRRVGRAARWKAKVDLRCHGEYTAIGWDFYETEERYKESRDACSTRIVKQPDAGTAELRNLSGPRSGIEVRWDLHDLAYQVYTVGGFGSSLLCGSLLSGTGSNASYRGAAKIFPSDTPEHRLSLRLSG